MQRGLVIAALTVVSVGASVFWVFRTHEQREHRGFPLCRGNIVSPYSAAADPVDVNTNSLGELWWRATAAAAHKYRILLLQGHRGGSRTGASRSRFVGWEA
jgi:hypothetical protein